MCRLEFKFTRNRLPANSDRIGRKGTSAVNQHVQIVKSMNKRNKIGPNVCQNPDAKSALTALDA